MSAEGTPRLRMFAGPNGSGKSTIKAELPPELLGVYVNPDDLRYEARDIDQDLTSTRKIDQWFTAKTRGMTEVTRQRLKEKWGAMQKVPQLAPAPRADRGGHPVRHGTKDRLMSGRGNAMLVTSSIYEARRYYEIFSKTELEGKCTVEEHATVPALLLRQRHRRPGSTQRQRSEARRALQARRKARARLRGPRERDERSRLYAG